jgi:hypothetical protein
VIISEKQLMMLLRVLQMKLDEFEANLDFRNSLYRQILVQQSEELKVIES